MFDGHSRGLHRSREINPAKKGPCWHRKGKSDNMVCAEKERTDSVTFAGGSPHTTACGPTISSGGSEFDIAAVSIKRCRRCYYGDWREDRQWSALQGLEDCPGVLRS